MAWNSKPKNISITATTDHPSQKAGVIGRPPGVHTIQFTPAEFFGAAARCSHLNVINPKGVTYESATIKALVEPYVNDLDPDFAIESSADNFKDFMKSYFAGTVASGLAYLSMIADGYRWSDHFENIKGGNSAVRRTPDFVFARDGRPDVALVESKGTRSDTAKGFDSTVEDGYINQVEPHLGFTIGSSTASHGYCVGSYLKSPTIGELNVHYTDLVTVSPTGPPGGGPGTNATVQRHNYATAFRLAHSELLSEQIRRGQIEDRSILFSYFDWLGRQWITAPRGLSLANIGAGPSNLVPLIGDDRWRFVSAPPWRSLGFAVERDSAASVLAALSRGAPEHFEVTFDLPAIPDDLRQRAALETGGGAAIFPDGLAAFIRSDFIGHIQPIVWLRDAGGFLSLEDWLKQQAHQEFYRHTQSTTQQQPATQQQSTYRYLTNRD